MSRALLDVNVLIALFDPDHVHHERARQWLGSEIHHGWASCAITQNGFARVVSQSSYPGRRSVQEAIDRIEEATASAQHEFWGCSVSLADTAKIDRSRILGPNQLTDIYLLALATNLGGRLVTLDRRVPLSAVPGATAANIVEL